MARIITANKIEIKLHTSKKSIYREDEDILEIDLTGCDKLEELFCYRNNLTSLDVSMCTNLRALVCQENNIKHLDLSKNTRLRIIYCDNDAIDLNTIPRSIENIYLYIK